MGNTTIQKSILLVDDEIDIVKTLSIALQKSGLSIIPFTDPKVALNYFKENSDKIHAIVSDVRMPGMSGFELAKNIKQIKPQLKTILLTGYEIHSITLEKLKDTSEVDHVLYKPVSPDRILDLLKVYD